MEIVSANLNSVFVAFGVGAVIGLLLRCNLVLLIAICLTVSGLLALAVTGEWRDFFKDGYTFAHFIYLAGYCMISIVFFGPFGSASGVMTRLLKSHFYKSGES